MVRVVLKSIEKFISNKKYYMYLALSIRNIVLSCLLVRQGLGLDPLKVFVYVSV